MIQRSILTLVLLLGVLFLAGCQSQSSGSNDERRGGFYTGAIGGWTRP